jgi:hypothetical protein
MILWFFIFMPLVLIVTVAAVAAVALTLLKQNRYLRSRELARASNRNLSGSSKGGWCSRLGGVWQSKNGQT